MTYTPATEEEDQTLVDETPIEEPTPVTETVPEPEPEPQSSAGGGLQVDDDGNVTWEGDTFKETEQAQSGRDPISELAAQIPIVSTVQTLGGGAGVGLSVFIQEALKDGVSMDDIKAAIQESGEYIRHDVTGGGVGRSVSRMVIGGAVDAAQNVSNLVLDPERKLSEGDVGILFGEPLDRIESQNFVEDMGKVVSNIAGLIAGWKVIAGPAIKGAIGFGATKLSQGTIASQIAPRIASQQALNKSVQTIIANQVAKGGIAKWGTIGAKLATEGALIGAAYDYTMINRVPNGYWKEVEGLNEWVSTQPWFMPSLARISPDDTVRDAAAAEALNGAFIYGPAGNTAFFGIFKGARRLNWFWKDIHKPRIRGEVTAALKDNLENGGRPIKEQVEKSKTVGFNQKKIQNLREKGGVKPPLWENGLEFQETLDLDEIVRTRPEEADQIIANTPPDQVYEAAIEITGRDLDAINLETQRALGATDDTRPGVSRPDYTQEPTAQPALSQTRVENVNNMVVRPQEMQYKAEGQLSKTGVSGSVAKAKYFDHRLADNITVWRDPSSNELVVVNGHNRLALAKKTGTEQVRVLEVEAGSAQEARTIGALQNIAQGMGTPIDAAKLMRDADLSPEVLARKGIDLGGPIARKAIPLSRLPEDIFTQVSQGKMTLDRGMALGSVEGLDPAIVRDVAKKAQRSRWSAAKIEQAIQEAKFASVEEGPADLLTLLGDTRFDPKTSNFGKLIDLRTEAYKRLREEMIALTSAARGGARKDILEQAGNVVDVAGSRAAKDKAQVAARVFNEVTAYKGPVRNVLDQMAEELNPGTTVKKVVDANLERLREAIRQEIEGGFNKPAPTPVRQVDREVRAITPKSKAIDPEVVTDKDWLSDEEWAKYSSSDKDAIPGKTDAEKRAFQVQMMKDLEEYRDSGQLDRDQRLFDARPAFTLEESVGTPKPTYRNAKIWFESDVDKAIYIVSGKGKSKSHNKFVAWLKDKGILPEDIDAIGQEIRATLKREYKPDLERIRIEDTQIWLKEATDENLHQIDLINLDKQLKATDPATLEIEALGPEPTLPEPPRGGEIGFREGDAKVGTDDAWFEARESYEKGLRAYNEYWNKVEAIQEKHGKIRSWDEILDSIPEENLDEEGFLSWLLPHGGDAGDITPARGPYTSVDYAGLIASDNNMLKEEILKIAGMRDAAGEKWGVDVRFPNQIRGKMTLRQALAYGVEPGKPYFATGKFEEYRDVIDRRGRVLESLDVFDPDFVQRTKELYDELTLSKDTVQVAVYNEAGLPIPFESRLSAAYHEAFHRLQLRFFTPRELQLLKRNEKALRKLAARDVRGDLRAQILDGTTPRVEVEAIAFANWWKYTHEYAATYRAPWVRPFQRLRQILRRVSNFVRGGGFKTWEDLFEEALEGKIADREMRPDAFEKPFAGDPGYSNVFWKSGRGKEPSQIIDEIDSGRWEVDGRRLTTEEVLDDPTAFPERVQDDFSSFYEDGLLSVDNNSKPPNLRGGEGGGPDDTSFARKFAELYEQNREQILSGEIDAGDLWAQNNFTSVQSESGKYVYNFQSEDLLAGMEGMTRADGRTRAELTGRAIWNGPETQKIAHEWFKRNAENPDIGGAVLRGLASVSQGFYGHEVGALHRAMDFADKLQARAQTEASKWINASTNPNIDKRVQLARLVVSADSARRMHIAIANITRRWSHLGLEMQLPRDIDTYNIPDNYRLPSVPENLEAKGPGPGGGVVDSALREEIRVPAGANPVIDELSAPFAGLNESLKTGIVDLDAQVAGDSIADALLIMSDKPSTRGEFWKKWDVMGYGKNEEGLGKAVQMVRASNLISSGLTASKAIVNGVFNLSQLTASQSLGGLLNRDLDRSMYALQMFGSYWNNIRAGFSNASTALRTGRPVGNMDRSSLDFLDTKAMQEAQGELIPSGEKSGYTINFPNLDPRYAETSIGKLQTALWRILATPGNRIAVGIDSFNSTVAGWSYEYFRHMPRGMELAVEAGFEKFSKEAFDYAYKYAERRLDNALKDAVIDGKTFSDVALEGPHAQKFMDAVNFTDDVMAELEPRTVRDGFERGKARGLEGEELTEFANKWVQEGDFMHRMAETALNGPIPFGRIGSVPGILLTELAQMPTIIGPTVRFVQPFMRVPTNILKTGLRSSPAAPFVDTFWRDIVSEDIGTRQRAIGQVVLGSTALGMLVMGTNLGRIRINGGGPIDPVARQKWISDRQMQRSIQFWNDEENYWDAPISLTALEPYATLFAAVGDYNDIQAMLPQTEKDRLAESLVMDMVQLSISGQVSATYFQGIDELVQAGLGSRSIFTGPNRVAAQSRLLSRAIASMIPPSAMMKQNRKIYDPTPRAIEPGTGRGLPAFFEETLSNIKALVPGYSEDNPAIIDWSAPGGVPVHAPAILFSREMAENFPWMAWTMQFIPPIAAFGRGRMITDPVKQEMAGLHGTGTAFLGPTASDFGSGEVYLTPGELNEYRKIFATVTDETGRTWHESVTLLINSEKYELARQKDTKEELTIKKGEVPHRAALIQIEITEFKELAKERFELTVPKGMLIKEQREKREEREKALEVIKLSGGYDSSNANLDLLQLNV